VSVQRSSGQHHDETGADVTRVVCTSAALDWEAGRRIPREIDRAIPSASSWEGGDQSAGGCRGGVAGRVEPVRLPLCVCAEAKRWSALGLDLFYFSFYTVQKRVQIHTWDPCVCPGTSKLACWRVQLPTASKVGCRGVGTTASIEASLLAGDISDPPAKMVPFMLADELCRPPA
jgi:hypothetical protein